MAYSMVQAQQSPYTTTKIQIFSCLAWLTMYFITLPFLCLLKNNLIGKLRKGLCEYPINDELHIQ